jgi:hypothetical protein
MAAAARQLLAPARPKTAPPSLSRAAKPASSRLARDPLFMRTVDRLQGTTSRLLRQAADDEVARGRGARPRSNAPALQRMRDARFSSLVEPRVQAMRVSSPHDPAEHEAHATAQAIVGMAEPDEALAGAGPQDEAADGGAELDAATAAIAGRPPVIARKADGPSAAPHGVMGGIARARGMGRPLPSNVRRFMEPRFRADFSGVRIHTGDHAARLNRQLSAHAFTFGDELFFGRDRFQPETQGGRELIAHELTHTIQQGAVAQDRSETVQRSAGPDVSSTTPPHLQRLGVRDVLDYFADKANLIPGFRMFTIVLGVNPVNLRSVDRSAANILRAVVEFLPGGNLITRVLDSYGVFDKAGAWVEGQLAELGISGASIKAAIDRFIDSLHWSDVFDLGGVWDRARAILGDPVGRILTFVGTLFGAILDMIKDAVLRPLAQLASQTAGWDLLCAVLGKNPITGDPVPRNAETLIGGFMKLIGQEEIWENIKKGNAIARAFAWFQGAVEGALGFVREFPTVFLPALKSLTIEDLVLLPQAFIKVGRAFGDFIGRFFSWAGSTIWDLLEIIFSVVAPSVIVYIKKAAAAFKTILKNPIGFVRNLVAAGKQGLGQFASNFVTHLKKALINWLTGALSGAGIYIPQALSLVEFGKLALSVLGVSWPQIRAKIVKVLPGGEKTMKVLETGFDIVVALVKGGPAAAWEVIKDKLAGLRDTILQGVISFVTESIVKAAIKRLIGFLVPGGAFIQAILTIVDTVTVFVQKLKDIAAVVAAFIDSIAAIANGQIGAAAGRVEAALGSALNVVVAFLARFVGLGKVTDKVVAVVTKLQARVDKALDAAIAWIVAKAKALFSALFGKRENKKDGKEVDTPKALAEPVPPKMGQISPGLTAELAAGPLNKDIYSKGGDPKEVTKQLLAQHPDAHYDGGSGMLTLPPLKGEPLMQAGSLAELGQLIAQQLGVTKVTTRTTTKPVEITEPYHLVRGAPGPDKPSLGQTTLDIIVSINPILRILSGALTPTGSIAAPQYLNTSGMFGSLGGPGSRGNVLTITPSDWRHILDGHVKSTFASSTRTSKVKSTVFSGTPAAYADILEEACGNAAVLRDMNLAIRSGKTSAKIQMTLRAQSMLMAVDWSGSAPCIKTFHANGRITNQNLYEVI